MLKSKIKLAAALLLCSMSIVPTFANEQPEPIAIEMVCIARVDCGDGFIKCGGKECASSTRDGGSVTCDGKTTKC